MPFTSQAIENSQKWLERYPDANRLRDLIREGSSVAYCLEYTFRFSDTPQGSEYWWRIVRDNR